MKAMNWHTWSSILAEQLLLQYNIDLEYDNCFENSSVHTLYRLFSEGYTIDSAINYLISAG